MTTRLVFLVPGFFGFTSVGAVSYFERVEQALGQALRRRGLDARIVRCRTQPTASIPRRVEVLRRQVVRRGGLDAAVADRPGVDYGCVVAAVPKPREQVKAAELLDPEYLALRALFRLLHALTARPHPRYPNPKPTPAMQRRLAHALGFKTTPATNDGIVPAWSQLHGRLLHVARADHLDVVGHYTLAGWRTADWLPSGAGFTTEAFEAIWDAVAGAIARSGRAPGVAGRGAPC